MTLIGDRKIRGASFDLKASGLSRIDPAVSGADGLGVIRRRALG